MFTGYWNHHPHTGVDYRGEADRYELLGLVQARNAQGIKLGNLQGAILNSIHDKDLEPILELLSYGHPLAVYAKLSLLDFCESHVLACTQAQCT